MLRASPHQRGAHALQSLSAGASVNHEAPTLAKRVKRKIENCQSEVKMSRVVQPLPGVSAAWTVRLLRLRREASGSPPGMMAG